MKFLSNTDFSQNQALNFVYQSLSSAPSSPKNGQSYFLTSANGGMVWNGTAWRPMDAALLTDGSIQNSALATNPLARANHTGTQLAATISNLQTTVTAYTLDQFATPVANLNFGGFRLTNIATATSSTDAARWDQVQSAITAAVAGQTSPCLALRPSMASLWSPVTACWLQARQQRRTMASGWLPPERGHSPQMRRRQVS